MPATIYQRIEGNVEPLPDDILVVNMERGGRVTKGGIRLLNDDGENRGIRPRWAQIYKIGKNIDYVEPGEWVLIAHGRWSYGIEVVVPEGDPNEIFYVQKIDTNEILVVTDEKPSVMNEYSF